MVESINGHMTRYFGDMWQKEGRNRELWNSMESHGRLKERNCIYIHYLVIIKQAYSWLQTFVFLCVFFCLVFFRFTNRLVFWRIVLLSISYSCYPISQQVFFGCLLITTYFKTKSRRNLGHIFPEQSGDPWPGTGPGSLRYIVWFTPNTLPSSHRFSPHPHIVRTWASNIQCRKNKIGLSPQTL